MGASCLEGFGKNEYRHGLFSGNRLGSVACFGGSFRWFCCLGAGCWCWCWCGGLFWFGRQGWRCWVRVFVLVNTGTRVWWGRGNCYPNATGACWRSVERIKPCRVLVLVFYWCRCANLRLGVSKSKRELILRWEDPASCAGSENRSTRWQAIAALKLVLVVAWRRASLVLVPREKVRV